MADPSPLWGRGAGYRLLRYWDNEVLGNTDGVLQHIIKAVNHPHPSPLPERETENTLRGGKRETAVDGDSRLHEFRTRFLPKLVAEFHPTLVLAFGSRAKGEGWHNICGSGRNLASFARPRRKAFGSSIMEHEEESDGSPTSLSMAC